jgi:hypothetical protein
MVYLTNKLELILDELDIELAEDCVFIMSDLISTKRVKEILETQQLRSCIISKKKAKEISKLIGQDIPLYDGNQYVLQEGDMIIVYIDYPLAVDESAIDPVILSALPRFETIGVVKYQHAPSELSADAMI